MRIKMDLNQKWAFSKEADRVPQTMPTDWYWVNLPHTWNAIDGQDGGNDYYRATCYYAKNIKRSEMPDGKRIYLEIPAANSSADVYLNGFHLSHHDGGYSCWRTELTGKLEDENLLVIAVDNSSNGRVYPQKADFTFYGGLYRGLSLIGTDEIHFALTNLGGPGIKVTPQMEDDTTDAEVIAEVELEGSEENREIQQFRIQYEILDKLGETVSRKVSADKMVRLIIPHVHRWDGVLDPYLYTIRATLFDKSNTAIDQIMTVFGCRSFRVDVNEGFILNGRAYPLRGVSRHQDRQGIGNALLPENHKEDIDIICEMGCNCLRLAHYQHDQYFYDLCDERGMIVWAEIPYISEHLPDGNVNCISQMKELISQNYNHPGICFWGLSNEVTMTGGETEGLIENHVNLNNLVHDMDATRLTTMAVIGACDRKAEYIKIPDVVSYNHYMGWYSGAAEDNGPWFDHFHEQYPEIPVGMSEYGCEGLWWHSSIPERGDYTEEFQAIYHEKLIKQLFTRKYIWSAFVWTMFDFGSDDRNEGGEAGQNHKGLVTFDRKYKKDAFYIYKANLSSEPFVHICSKGYVERAEEETEVKVYSNLPEVELFVNGEFVGTAAAEDHIFRFMIPNAGESQLRASAGEYSDEAKICKVEHLNEKYVLKDQSVILNWFEVTSPEGYFSLKDVGKEIMKSEEGCKVYMEIFIKLAGGLRPSGKEKKDTEKNIQRPSMEQSTSQLSRQGKDNISATMKMLQGMTVMRLVSVLQTHGGVPVTKEELLELNRKLNRIKK